MAHEPSDVFRSAAASVPVSHSGGVVQLPGSTPILLTPGSSVVHRRCVPPEDLLRDQGRLYSTQG